VGTRCHPRLATFGVVFGFLTMPAMDDMRGRSRSFGRGNHGPRGEKEAKAMQTITVGKLLQGKEGKKVWTIGPEASVYEALELMSAHDLGALVVTEQGRVVGLFSERDYARKVILRGKSSRTARVREMMSTPVLYATPDESVEDCLRVMTVKRIRHLPVLDGQQLVGIVSIGDAVERIIAEQKFEIGQLEKYIHGTGYN